MSNDVLVRAAVVWAHDPVWQYLAREVFSTADELTRRFGLEEVASISLELHVDRDRMSDIGATLQTVDRQVRLAGAFTQAVSHLGISGLEGLPLPRALLEDEGGLLIVSIHAGSWRFGARFWGALENIAKSGPMAVVLMLAQLTGLSVMTAVEYSNSKEQSSVVVEIDQSTAPTTIAKLQEELPKGSIITVQIEQPDGTIITLTTEHPPDDSDQRPL